MSINAITILGLIAGFLTTINALPQVIKTWKTKKTKDISLLMYVTLTLGIILWLIYGLLVQDLPLILANSITLILVFIVLIFKLKYG